MISARPRPVFLVTLVLSVGLISAILYLTSTDPRSTSSTIPNSSYTTSSTSTSSYGTGPLGRVKSWFGLADTPVQYPNSIPVELLEAYYQSHLNDLSSNFDSKVAEEKYGLLFGQDVTLPSYTANILSIYNEYLSGTPEPGPWLAAIHSRLSLRPSMEPLAPCPTHIMTTDKTIEHLPVEFARWKEIMPSWGIRYFDDQGLEDWVEKVFGGTRAQRIWQELPQRVLQTDVFRYMAMLVEGGVYTDSDTAPIIHAGLWGRPYQDATPSLLTHLSRLISYAMSPILPFSSSDIPSDEGIYGHSSVNDGSSPDEPAVVISIEADAVQFQWDHWREMRMARAVQITQWTFQARPGHPIFLDALGRALKKAEQVHQETLEAEAKGETYTPESALEWTGPGLFSDCVYRYLLARYGFQPEQLISRLEPTRIGDVLILPAGSFSSMNPFLNETQRPWAAVWHGFAGRWREGDPGQQEFEEELKEELGEDYRPISEDAKTVATAIEERS